MQHMAGLVPKRGMSLLRFIRNGRARAAAIVAAVGFSTAIPGQAQIQYVYDAAGRAIEEVLPSGASNQFTYDPVGNIAAVTVDASTTLSIAQFAPNTGLAGTVVTINGSGFNSTAAANTVSFNGQAATVSAATPTSLTVVVPAGAGSGPITVSNGNGSVSSTSPFTVGPAVSVTSGASAITLAANQSTTVSFAGTAGQGVSLGFSSLATQPSGGTITAVVTQPGGTSFITCTATTDSGCTMPYLPVSGTYTITLSAGTAAATFSFAVNNDVAATLAANQSATFTAATVGQAATYTLALTTGQFANLLVSGDDFAGATVISIFAPSGTLWRTVTMSSTSGFGNSALISLQNPPASGNYQVRVVPQGGTTGGITLENAQTVTGTLSVDGSASAISLGTGQLGAYTFSGTTGQQLGLGLTNLNAAIAVDLTISLLDPTGSQVASFSTHSSPYGFMLPALAKTGTYTVLMNTQQVAASFSVQLSSDLAGGTLTANGPAVSFAPSKIGQGGTYSFAGTAAQNPSLLLAGNTISGNVLVSVYQPNGALYLTTTVTGASNVVNVADLPATGTYVVRIMPQYASSGSLAISLLLPVTGTLVPDAAATPISLGANQVGTYTFNGSIGQNLGLGITGLTTTPSGGYLTVKMTDPGNVSLGSFSVSAGSGGYVFAPLTKAGVYTVQFSSGTYAASFNALLSSDLTASMTVGGAAATLAPARAGQAATFSFSGSAGQNLNLILTGDTIPGSTDVYVIEPNGTILSSVYVYYSSSGGSASLALSNLPVSGTYTVRAVPANGGTGSLSAAITQDVAGTLSIDGAAIAISLANDNGKYTFSGTAGQSIGMGWTGLTTTPTGGTVNLAIYNPAGSLWYSCSGSAATGACILPWLTSSGTYTIKVTRAGSATALNLQLSSDLTANLTVSGAAIALAPARAGQAATYTFSGSAGQNLNLILTGDTIPGNSSVYVYEPNGTTLASTSIYYGGSSAGAGALALSNLPASGTYTIRVMPYGGATGSVTAAITQDVTGTLSIDGAATAINLVNNNGSYTFSGTAGQNLGMGWTGLSTTPAGGSLTLRIYGPTGNSWLTCGGVTATGGCTLQPLPTSGTYTVYVTRAGSATSLNLALSSDLTASLTAGGPAVTLAPAKPGQSATYSFNVTAGQNINLAFSGDTIPGSTTVYVYDPKGAALGWAYVNNVNGTPGTGTRSFTNVSLSGTYTIRLYPASGATGSFTVALTN